ncbi:hypothetical protein M3666_08590 [Curtobacterium sp. ODYSSEY 48 V2]|uniref:hypothetical protein n=2 Tax=unclassified Curtobacterium TaxID=257496 RepID=UPI001AE5CB50|nr:MULTISPECIES: hypothetical protein [unclassified Curtobacterium]MBP1300491.1 hypothetical protein [Curtobacterium sp. 1310]MCM3505168.1 hypothetical protein [Curtobacterium sp. ODYSSEY 48 V2]
MPDDADVLGYDAPAAAIARALRRSRRAGTPRDDALVTPLDELGHDPVLVRQVDLGDEVLTVLLRASDGAFLSATVTDRTAGVETISAAELATLLAATAAPGADRALELVRLLAPDDRVRLFEQGARAAAETFATKYGLAAERGFTVLDLESFVAAVARFDADDLPFCALDAPGVVATVAFTPDRTAVLATTIARRLRHDQDDDRP